MNYADFLKSKRIAERWGEAHAAFESSENSPEVAYYQEILSDFYDYIQQLEAQLFTENATEPATLPEKNENLQPAPAVFSPSAQAFTDAPVMQKAANLSENQLSSDAGLVTDEEDPWFGFTE